MSGGQERYAVCISDHAWEAALDAVKDRSIVVQNKDKGLIETGWLEIPMPGRTYGVFQREISDSRDRSRLTLTVKQLQDVVKLTVIEERQRWAFRGGSRLYGWAPTDPSPETLREVNKRLDAKLQEQGCTLT